MDYNAISTKSLQIFFDINAETFQKQYKQKLSNYNSWEQKEHAEQYLIFPDNMGEFLSIDETALSNGELYTLLTNKVASGQKGTIVGIFKGVQSDNIINLIKENIAEALRNKIEEITLDLSPTMNAIAKSCFRKAARVADRFHVQRLAYDAVQQIRIKYR